MCANILFCVRNADNCKMSASLLSLHYLPNAQWFKNYLAGDLVLIEQHENFVKSTCRNRCYIVGANGKQILTIPLSGGRDHHQKYTETRISYQNNWQDNHWQSIKSAYGSTPYFEFYAHIFQNFYERQPEFLFDFNIELLKAVLKALKIKKEFAFSESYQKAPENVIDLRDERKSIPQAEQLPRYYQVFDDKHGFTPDLSIIDLVFNLGPGCLAYLTQPVK